MLPVNDVPDPTRSGHTVVVLRVPSEKRRALIERFDTFGDVELLAMWEERRGRDG